MYTCTACGSNIPDGKRFCPQCGAMFDQMGRVSAPVYAYQAPDYQALDIIAPEKSPEKRNAPAYDYQNPEKSHDRPLKVGEFFVALLLMSIPAIGLLLQIIWTCGAGGNKNRTNLARAYLIWTIILLTALFFGLYWFMTNLWPELEPLLDYFNNIPLG